MFKSSGIGSAPIVGPVANSHKSLSSVHNMLAGLVVNERSCIVGPCLVSPNNSLYSTHACGKSGFGSLSLGKAFTVVFLYFPPNLTGSFLH